MADEMKVTAERLDFAAQEMRCRAEGHIVRSVIWPTLPIGTKFVIVTDRGNELLATGIAAEATASGQHVRVDFDAHELEKGRWYRVRPRREGDDALPRVQHDA